MLIVRTHEYFLAEAQQRRDPLHRAVRERVATCLAVSESLVARVVASWNRHGDDAFAAPPAKRGRPPRSMVEAYHDYITDIINDRNLSQKPTTSKIICAELQSLAGVAIPERTMRKELQTMDVSYIRGRKRDPRADSKVNIAFRHTYLKKKISNLTGRSYPKKVEIYLDESYCNVNHVAGATWVTKNSPRYCASGAGQRYCIVGAGAVLVKNGRLHAEWVPTSIKSWPSHLKGDDTDYHGNFNGPLFERWLEDLCRALSARYGPCRIHMDGAAYHKVIEDRAPTKSSPKRTLVDWLHKHGVTVSADSYSKKRLERLIAQAKPPTYRAVTMAQQYGHEILYTPPYHPELQPIEMIWGALKNRIALDPATSVEDLGKKIKAGLMAITKRQWLGAYRKVRKQEITYLNAACPPEQIPAPSFEELQQLGSEPTRAQHESEAGVEFTEYEIQLTILLGGNLRDFLSEKNVVIDSIDQAVSLVGAQVAELLNTQYALGSEKQIDRLRMTSVRVSEQDRKNQSRSAKYTMTRSWFCVITSEYALRQLGKIVAPSYYKELWSKGHMLGDDGLMGIAFENYVHTMARDRMKIELLVRTYDRRKKNQHTYTELEFKANSYRYEGTDEAECEAIMKQLADVDYWFPCTRCLETIDSVAKLNIGGRHDVVDLIQIVFEALDKYVKPVPDILRWCQTRRPVINFDLLQPTLQLKCRCTLRLSQTGVRETKMCAVVQEPDDS